jgi:hypothetical protein
MLTVARRRPSASVPLGLLSTVRGTKKEEAVLPTAAARLARVFESVPRGLR